jgi:tripeptidyl-peptidase-1
MRFTAFVLALGAAHATNMVQMEKGITIFEAPNWQRGSRVTSTDEVDVTFVVKTCSMKRAELEKTFWDISNPKSESYKKYQTLDEITSALRPAPAGEPTTTEYIVDFLTTENEKRFQSALLIDTPRVTKSLDMVSVKMSATAAEEFFSTELYTFAHANGVHTLIRAGAPYHLPESLSAKVSFVEKLVRLPYIRQPKAPLPTMKSMLRGAVNTTGDDAFDSCDTALCSAATTPAVLSARYGQPTLATFTEGNSMAVAEFQFQGVDDDDLALFSSTCGVDHVEVDTVEGAGGSLHPGVEALLDVEYIEAVAAPIPLTVINSVSYSLFDWAESLNNDDDAALVQSVSYGNDECQQTSDEYMYECNTQFMQGGVRGLSLLFASGDQGVWGRTGHVPDVFHPDFPAGSPYITAVGGTDFATKSTIGEESTWADGGGGFSNTFAMPSFQADAVSGYFSSGVSLPDSSLYNSTGRGYPDVAALAGTANGYCVAASGHFMKVGGTSAACPVFAGMIAQINDNLLAAGKAQMGYLNQWIYGVAAPAGAFYDVTTGQNNAGFGEGFTATTGWDPATGYGTPNFPTMLEVAMA